VTYELPRGVQGQSFEYKQQEQMAEWTIKKF